MDRTNDLHLTQPGAQADTRRKGKGYAWATLAALTCPCHVPIYALLLSGTALVTLIFIVILATVVASEWSSARVRHAFI